MKVFRDFGAKPLNHSAKTKSIKTNIFQMNEAKKQIYQHLCAVFSFSEVSESRSKEQRQNNGKPYVQ